MTLAYILKLAGLFSKEDKKTLSNLIFYVTLPASLISGFTDAKVNIYYVVAILTGFGVNTVMGYSSVSNTSLSSNVVFSQRVRTFDDALDSSQINCVDGSVLFASLLRSINIDPILVRTPGHMFVGYYTDNSHKDMNFLETTMIGDVDLDDFFPDEQLDSTMVGKSQNEMSLLTFEKSKQYANKKYKENEEGIHSGKLNYMFLEISKEVRRKIQPIGK